MAGVVRAESRSVNAQARSLGLWDQRYNQIASGSFSGATDVVDLDDVILAREKMSLEVEQRPSPPEGFVAFSIPSLGHQIVSLDSRQDGKNRTTLMRSGARYHAMTGKGSDILVISMRESLLCEALDALDIECSGKATLGVSYLPGLFKGLDAILELAKANPSKVASAEFCRYAVQYVKDQCVLAISSDTSMAGADASWRIDRKRIVRRACDRAEEVGLEAATLVHMQQAAKVSPRILQYAFQEVLGLSPLRWLILARLNNARRGIENSTFGSVTETALGCSFNHLGRFSSSYRTLFNESPTQTFRKSGTTSISCD